MAGGICCDNAADEERFSGRIAPRSMRRQSLLGLVSCKGTREQCAEFLHGYARMGVHGIVFCFNDIAAFGSGDSQAEVFRREVLPMVE
jgi:hypothetical protein